MLNLLCRGWTSQSSGQKSEYGLSLRFVPRRVKAWAQIKILGQIAKAWALPELYWRLDVENVRLFPSLLLPLAATYETLLFVKVLLFHQTSTKVDFLLLRCFFCFKNATNDSNLLQQILVLFILRQEKIFRAIFFSNAFHLTFAGVCFPLSLSAWFLFLSFWLKFSSKITLMIFWCITYWAGVCSPLYVSLPLSLGLLEICLWSNESLSSVFFSVSAPVLRLFPMSLLEVCHFTVCVTLSLEKK